MVKKKKTTCLLFNEDSRREFVTGFHKRKVEKQKRFQEKLKQDLKETKKRIKIKARETLEKITHLRSEINVSLEDDMKEHYELPGHSVRIEKLKTEGILWEKNHEVEETEIGRSSKSSCRSIQPDIPLTNINSIKDVKKVLNKQSIAIMQQDRTFRKKFKIERLKNKKEASRKNASVKKHGKKGRGKGR